MKKIMAQAEENAKAVTSTETAEDLENTTPNPKETENEPNEISLTSTPETEEKEQTPKVNGDMEAYNYFGGNEHVSPINGSLNYRKTLFTIKGVGGFDLPIEASYNSERAHSV